MIKENTNGTIEGIFQYNNVANNLLVYEQKYL